MSERTVTHPVVVWSHNNLAEPVRIVPISSNRVLMAAAYAGIFAFPVLFIVGGFVWWLTTEQESDVDTAIGSMYCGGALLIPFGTIALLGYFVRRRFPRSLDASGVRLGDRTLGWENLLYVDHVTKFVDRGNVSDRKIPDNTLQLVFSDGFVDIPPLIAERERIWNLIHSIPCEHRIDGKTKIN